MAPTKTPTGSPEQPKDSKEPEFTEREKKAFDFAQETTKQLLTLATGIIALTITFSKDFVGTENITIGATNFLIWSWMFYLLSIIFGMWTLMALTGTLQPKDEPPTPMGIRGLNVTLPSGLQVVTFLLGLISTVVFGIKSLCPIWPFC